MFMQALSTIDRSMLIIDELFPPPRQQSIFDKSIDLLKALSCSTITGAIGQVLETGIKAFQTISTSRHKVEAVKYVADMYELKLRSQDEIRRIDLQVERNRAIERSLTLYIERSFQLHVDKLTKEHLVRMRECDNERDTIIHKIDKYAEIQLREIEQRYAMIIRENEVKCAFYRQSLQDMYERQVTPADLVKAASEFYFSLIQQSFQQGNGNSKNTQALLGNIMEYIRCMGDPSKFISFETFIEQRKKITR
jgi:hypothetical protein